MTLTMSAARTTATQDAHPAVTEVQVDTNRNLNPVDARRKTRRAVNAAGLSAADAVPLTIGSRRDSRQSEQPAATDRAPQISRIRASATRPIRSTRIAIETLSIDSRLTAERSGTGSSPGSRSTSLGMPRICAGACCCGAAKCAPMLESSASRPRRGCTAGSGSVTRAAEVLALHPL